jgi:hypothetical protein
MPKRDQVIVAKKITTYIVTPAAACRCGALPILAMSHVTDYPPTSALPLPCVAYVDPCPSMSPLSVPLNSVGQFCSMRRIKAIQSIYNRKPLIFGY